MKERMLPNRYRWIGAIGVAVVVLMVPTDGLLAQEEAAQTGAAEVAPADIEQMGLPDLMERMSDDFTQLKRTVRDADQRDTTLGLLTNMQRLSIAARQLRPQLEDVPEVQREAWLTDYRVRLIALNQKLLDAERAALEGRTTDAFDAVKEMAILQRDGHEKFRVDDH